MDHTLIFAKEPFDEAKLPLDSKKIELKINDTTLWLFKRNGLDQFIEFVSQFCNLYVFSKGYKQYIYKILETIDPN